MGEGVLGARQRVISASPYDAFFAYFLVRTQESKMFRLSYKR